MALARGPSSRPPASRRWRDRALLAGLVALVAAGLIAAASATGWEETMAQVARLTAAQVALLLVLSLVNYALRGLRWHVLVRRLGLGLGLARNMLHFLGGFAMTVTPGRMGELVRLRWVARETGTRFLDVTPLVLADRAADLAATALLLGAALAFSATGIAGGVPVTIIALAAAVAATSPALLARCAGIGHRITGRRLPRLFARLRRAARALTRFADGGTLSIALLTGVIGWAAEGYAFWLLLGWMGADVSLASAIAIFVFSAIAGGATGAPGGLGGAEAAMVALLSLQGVPLEVSLPATAIIRLTTLWFAILIGLAFFPLAERAAGRAAT